MSSSNENELALLNLQGDGFMVKSISGWVHPMRMS